MGTAFQGVSRRSAGISVIEFSDIIKTRVSAGIDRQERGELHLAWHFGAIFERDAMSTG